MRLFQILALPFIAAMLVVSIRSVFKPGRVLVSLFWVVLWAAAFLAVWYPDTTTEAARVLGIYRGVNLLIYTSVIGFTVGFYVVSLRLRQMSREITLLTREIALLEAERQGKPQVDSQR